VLTAAEPRVDTEGSDRVTVVVVGRLIRPLGAGEEKRVLGTGEE
jgi:hypothetical protein